VNARTREPENAASVKDPDDVDLKVAMQRIVCFREAAEL
jgi:hypothetical protein